MKKGHKSKTIIILSLTFLFVIVIGLLVFIPSYRYNKEQKKLYNDYVAVSNAVGLSYNKELDFYFQQIIANEKYSKEKTGLEKANIIFDYAKYNYIPVLDYLKLPSSNSGLLAAFSSYSGFINDSIHYNHPLAYDCVVDQNDDNSLYAKKIDDETVLVVFGKNMITKASLHDNFESFLHLNDYSQNDDYFYYELLKTEEFYDKVVSDLLAEEDVLPSEIDTKKLVDHIITNDEMYYEAYESVYVNTIANVFKDFVKYLTSFDLSHFEYELLETSFIVRRNVKLKNMPSKYYTYNWSVDMINLVEEAEKAKIPIYYY